MNLVHLPEPALEFGESLSYAISDPSYGLRMCGPFDFTRDRSFDSIRVVAIGPASTKDLLSTFWENILNGVEDNNYTFEGLLKLYRLNNNSSKNLAFISIEDFNGIMINKYLAAIDYAQDNEEFDLLLVVEPESGDIYTDLKHTLIRRSIANQYVELNTLKRARDIPVLQNFALASYAKIGGKPWSLRDPIITNSIIIGLSFHLLPQTSSQEEQRTILGIGQIIDQYGFYLTMHTSSRNVSDDVLRAFRKQFRSLYIPNELIQNLITGILQKFTSRPDLSLPERIIVHKTTPYHDEEILGLQAAMEEHEINEYAFIHIQENSIHRVYRESDKDAVRGMFLTFRDDFPEAILWTVGKVPSRFRKENEWQYYDKSGTKLGTSDPISLHLESASRMEKFDLRRAAMQILGLTKMRWNTTEISIRLPASIYFARRAGDFTKRAIIDNSQLDLLTEIDTKHFL